ncbi:MAG: cytochrome c maturation protein CcmE [Alphaproteobacteria bacterium]|nr:cytochrome c maturation protein CcmE [Alphaproteobacteria bacterium]
MSRKNRRMILVVLGLALLGSGAALVLTAMNDAIVFFFSPSEIKERNLAADQRVRLGGLVEDGSVTKAGGTVSFIVTDTVEKISVSYTGVLPDLFREGQGIVAEGRLGPDGVFQASEVLAKHDENYMPREVADALKKNGHWQPGMEPVADTP